MILCASILSNKSLMEEATTCLFRTSLRSAHSTRMCFTVNGHWQVPHSGKSSPESRKECVKRVYAQTHTPLPNASCACMTVDIWIRGFRRTYSAEITLPGSTSRVVKVVQFKPIFPCRIRCTADLILDNFEVGARPPILYICVWF